MSEMSVNAVLAQTKHLRDSGQYQHAIQLLTGAIEHTSDARLYFSRGFIFELMDQPTQAIVDYTRAIQFAPDIAKYYYNRGCVLSHALDQDDEAIGDFEKAIELDPDHAASHQECCLSLLLMGRAGEAMEHATIALKLAPGNATTHYCLGESQMSLRQYSDAVESFSRAMQLEPESANTWAALGRARGELGSKADVELAVQAYTKAIQLDPAASYFESRGGLRLKLGLVEEAIVDLNHALTLQPGDVTKLLIESQLALAKKRLREGG